MPSRFMRSLMIAPFIFSLQFAVAQSAITTLKLQRPLQDKNFFLLSLLENDARVQDALAADQSIEAIAAEREGAVSFAKTSCKNDATCLVNAHLWTDEEIRAVSLALKRLDANSPAMHALVENRLRPSRAYILFNKEPSGQLLVDAWQVCASGLNDVISVYGAGRAPRYPAIDSMSADAKSPQFQQQISSLGDSTATHDSTLFFAPSLHAAHALLALNHRDEAGRHEPMEKSVNEPAFRRIASTKWQKYPYSVIIVPGAGPSAVSGLPSKRPGCTVVSSVFG